MKNFIWCFIFTTIISCNNKTGKEKPSMPGAYLMTSQILNDGSKDMQYPTRKQLKIFTEDFVMYAQVNTLDSVSSFGVGSYTADTGTVFEHIVYRGVDTTYNAAPVTYKLNITKTPDGYEQVIPEIPLNSKNYRLTEIYQAVGSNEKSPLDGIWKETNSYILRGNDTAKNNRTQFKAFFAGNFIFGHTVRDSASKIHTGIGFGTFKMVGDNKVTETDLNSTYQIIAGQSFNVDIELSGTDHYKQIITGADGSKSVEFYKRLKK